LIPIVLFLVIGAVGMTYSPLGRALARRVGGDKGEHAEGVVLAEVDAVREEVQALRHEVGELQERLDFAERLLAQARDQGKIGPGGA
jgi:ubiquinone biosynthesis protein UbiJ